MPGLVTDKSPETCLLVLLGSVFKAMSGVFGGTPVPGLVEEPADVCPPAGLIASEDASAEPA